MYSNSRSLEMASFDRSYTSSYQCFVIIVTLFCIVCEIQRVIGRKSQIFYTKPVSGAPQGGNPVGILGRCLIMIKLEWLGYRIVQKLWRYVKPFRYNAGTWRTDRRTDKSISRVRTAMLTRDKNADIKHAKHASYYNVWDRKDCVFCVTMTAMLCV